MTDIDELLRPAFEALKHRAAFAIEQASAKIENVRRVRYGDANKASLVDLPTPRLQFRWEHKQHTCSNLEFTCWYEMVFALHEHDVRNDDKQGFGVVELGSTAVGGGTPPWERGALGDATPFRDGVHAKWDRKQFGGWPIYVIAPDGRTALMNDQDIKTE